MHLENDLQGICTDSSSDARELRIPMNATKLQISSNPGLGRAVQLAGAESALITLWKVNDAKTVVGTLPRLVGKASHNLADAYATTTGSPLIQVPCCSCLPQGFRRCRLAFPEDV